MASLVSATEVNAFTGDFINLFDTFKRDFVVHKESKKVISKINTDFLYGYGTSAQQANYTYEPVYKSFSGMIKYKDEQFSDEMSDVGSQIRYFAGDIRIKVQEDCKDYIKNGKTEKIVVDGKDFQLMTEESVKYFFGVKLYVFHLKYTN